MHTSDNLIIKPPVPTTPHAKTPRPVSGAAALID
jgi:hypothetical protein